MAVTIDPQTKIINILKADLTLLQTNPIEVYEMDINWFRLQLKDIEDDPFKGVFLEDTHSHFTEVVLGGLTFARVVQILSPYTITFEDGQYAVNLVGANSNIADKINPNQVSIRSYNSAGLVNATFIEREVLNAQRLIEGLRSHHKSTGNVYYWNPVSGDDNKNGLSPSDAVATFTVVHNLAQDNNHDVIICLPPVSVVAQNTIEPIQITKNWLFLRGPGFDFKFKPTSLINGAGIDIQANGVQLEGFHLDMADAGASATGIKCDGNKLHVKDVIVENTSAQGIYSTNGNHNHFERFHILNAGTDGLELGNACTYAIIENGFIETSGASGINISGTGCQNTVIKGDTILTKNTEYGLEIGASASDTHIQASVFFNGNTLGEILDSGTDTVDERGRVADRVWDEAISGHLTAGTTGKSLNDAGASGNPWGTSVTGNTDPGTFGELVGKKLLTVAKFLGLK